MTDQRPPSPPNSNNGDLQYGFQHPAQHNSATQCPPGESYRDHELNGSFGSQSHSGYPSTYNSPVFMAQEPMTRQHSHIEPAYMGYGDENAHHGMSYLGNENGYHVPMDRYSPSQGYGYGGVPAGSGVSISRRNSPSASSLTRPNQYPRHSKDIDSPPTPSASDHSSSGHRTRSGRVVKSTATSHPSSSSPSQEKRPRAKTVQAKRAARQAKGDKLKMPKLVAPLSELTKDFKHIPVKDMEQWVNRSTEKRQQEVEARNGYITRPMNSFMLYRSAFAERTKIWCLQNNHQVVSSVSGESWPLEPAEVRERYNTYAKIERENHQRAHPGYKFSPSKAQSSAKKRKAEQYDAEQSEPSDLDDVEYAPDTPRARDGKGRRNRRQDRSGSRSRDNSQYPDSPSQFHSARGGPVRSSFQANNPGKPLPAAMGHHDYYGQYYQTVHRPGSVPNVEDVRMKRLDQPQERPMAYASMTALPGGLHQDLVQAHHMSPSQMGSNALDPQLIAYDDPSNFVKLEQNPTAEGDPTSIDGVYIPTGMERPYDPVLGSTETYASNFLQDFPDPAEQGIDVHQLPGYHDSMHIATDDLGPWQIEPDNSEYDHWMTRPQQN
ncbi:MAG: DNA replication protein psf1 [Chaenotheca gracillima]|nr:MAG: DNA replication protein psf1 [Chaenotheca gracillima]